MVTCGVDVVQHGVRRMTLRVQPSTTGSKKMTTIGRHLTGPVPTIYQGVIILLAQTNHRNPTYSSLIYI